MSMAAEPHDRPAIEARFAVVFTHLGLIAAYAPRRGAHDPEAIAAEVMAIAWRRLADVPREDPRPWLIAAARNLVLADRRRRGAPAQALEGVDLPAPDDLPSPALDLDPELELALGALSSQDREALLLVAWEDLTPAAAAVSLGISTGAFRVRLHRARRRLLYELEARRPNAQLDPVWSGNDL
jgi:RNA polymerase sigma-70 factor, ECF subfamily